MMDAETGYVDIGGGHSIHFVGYEGDPHAGMNDRHMRPDNGKPCEGFISFTGSPWSNLFTGDGAIETWDIVSLEPLTLTPSLLCRICGDHGHITNGRWVPA